jgi:hypothetical protein
MFQYVNYYISNKVEFYTFDIDCKFDKSIHSNYQMTSIFILNASWSSLRTIFVYELLITVPGYMALTFGC